MLIDIEIPYTTQPKMKKYQGPLFNITPNHEYIAQKHLELQDLKNDLHGETHESVSGQLVRKTANFLKLTPTDSIIDLSLQLEEDIAIMYNGRLAAICFCFPSSWIPNERIGLLLEDIHKPVADSDKLIAASAKLAKTMAQSDLGPFRRQVWTITSNSKLSNHPMYKSVVEPKSINDLYLRIETQTSAAIGDNSTSVFLVKVEVISLATIWPRFGADLKKSINSMSTNILRYKNLEQIKTIVNNVLIM